MLTKDQIIKRYETREAELLALLADEKEIRREIDTSDRVAVLWALDRVDELHRCLVETRQAKAEALAVHAN